ncbi:MAG: hypothetical protein JWN40_938 [Phycisphaerales bacterium]|nr:hypothetical protein [Phycisphaerales bacterium]
MKRNTTTTSTSSLQVTPEHKRLLEHRAGEKNWKQWGPFVAERAWGTVREDYSADGSAWAFLPHDHARSKAYRWNEDGLAAICDEDQILCFSLALWNGRDSILKERLFGLTGPEGNHGEDVKELYYYLDATPTYSYLKYLYKYPQAEFPYARLVEANGQRSTFEPEFELLDTGVFNHSRYFDVVVEYAKAAPQDLVIRITVSNRGPDPAILHVIPQLWFRNTWAWSKPRGEEPLITVKRKLEHQVELRATHETLGNRFLYAAGQPEPLFTDNETNAQRLYQQENPKPHVKDAFHEYIVNQVDGVTTPDARGTKAGLNYLLEIPAGESRQVDLRLTPEEHDHPFANFGKFFSVRQREADKFYNAIHPENATDEERRVQRQAFAGMLWSKQFYAYDVHAWLHGDPAGPPPPQERLARRNKDWEHLSTADVFSMPDKWEYPWFAAWDLAFHVIPLAMIDVDSAKHQLELIISEKLQHPNGQIPAYEWEFSDVNPPVQAWAAFRVYNIEKHANGEKGDRQFLERCYHKLLLNFTWWVNRKDSQGRNIFQGGFLGLDNISVFDRSKPLPDGGYLEQADATGWMALFCLNMMAIGLELAQEDQVYEHLGIKFFEHFMAIAAAINRGEAAGNTLWDEEDGWYYDSIKNVDSTVSTKLKVRSLVGLIPLFAAQILDHSWFEKLPNFKARYDWLMTNRPDLSLGMMCIWTANGARCLLSIANFDRLKRILERTLDETEFLSEFGLRSLSRYHLAKPYVLSVGDREWTVRYEPAESTTRLFGGNSNWRGPIWFPTAFMLITALRVYDRFYGEMFTVECPRGSGQLLTLNQVAIELGRRLVNLFLPDENGKRPCFGDNPLLQHDPHFKDHLLFHEFFHGDNGTGLGASHQTGWTGLVAKLIEQQALDRAEAEKKAATDAPALTPTPS